MTAEHAEVIAATHRLITAKFAGDHAMQVQAVVDLDDLDPSDHLAGIAHVVNLLVSTIVVTAHDLDADPVAWWQQTLADYALTHP